MCRSRVDNGIPIMHRHKTKQYLMNGTPITLCLTRYDREHHHQKRISERR